MRKKPISPRAAKGIAFGLALGIGITIAASQASMREE